MLRGCETQIRSCCVSLIRISSASKDVVTVVFNDTLLTLGSFVGLGSNISIHRYQSVARRKRNLFVASSQSTRRSTSFWIGVVAQGLGKTNQYLCVGNLLSSAVPGLPLTVFSPPSMLRHLVNGEIGH